MKHKHKAVRLAVAGLLLCFLLAVPAGLAGCTNQKKSTDTSGQATVSTLGGNKDKDEFIYPEGVNFNGKVFKILNCSRDQWATIAFITTAGYNSDEVNDAIYERNERVRQNLGCQLKEYNFTAYELRGELDKTIAADSPDGYDITYQRMDEVSASVIEGKFLKLDNIPTIDLKKNYWAQDVLKAVSIAGFNYAAMSNLHLMGLESLWVVWYNADILLDAGITPPYEDVKNGTWTLEKLQNMSKEAADLKDDSSFDWNPTGKSIYGFTTFYEGGFKMIYGLGARYADKNAFDLPYLSSEGDRDFSDRAHRLAEFVSESGTFYYAGPPSTGDRSYKKIFLDGRAAFICAEIAYAEELRPSPLNFGVLPFPKYNEDQTNYQSTGIFMNMGLTIPRTNRESEKAGLLAEALSYESDQTVLGPYFDNRVCLKTFHGNHIGDDIEMMNIAKNSRGFDVYFLLGLGLNEKNEDKYRDEVWWAIARGTGNISSTIESFKSIPKNKIAELIKLW